MRQRAKSLPADNYLSAVAMDATGPVDLFLTDPEGRRLGHDPQSGQDFSEIPEASYVIDYPIMWPDGSGFQGGDPSGTKELRVPSPVVGT